MSGTSLDGIDAVLVDFAPNPPRLIAATWVPYPRTLVHELKNLITHLNDLKVLGQLDWVLGERLAAAVLDLLSLAKTDPRDVIAIGSHGQTILHQPHATSPFTLQIGDPNLIAERTGITTVADFRRRDIAAGGEGAPLVPAFHQVFFGCSYEDRVVVNIGGIANVTLLPRSGECNISGFDTGPGNVLLDAWVFLHLNQPYDQDGQWANAGRCSDTLLARLRRDPYFGLPPPKSTGTDYFNLGWLERYLTDDMPILPPQDVQATLTELTAQIIAQAIYNSALEQPRVIVCGGGAYNKVLMIQLAQALPGSLVEPSNQHGLAPAWVEATAFAWLAKQTLSHNPGNLPTVTGARHPVVLGGVYAGCASK